MIPNAFKEWKLPRLQINIYRNYIENLQYTYSFLPFQYPMILKRKTLYLHPHEYRKTPETLRFRGILCLDTMYLTVLYIYIFVLISDYSMIVATRPEPTVRPPSRIANVRPWSIAIGWISSIVISTLSPGMHISTPSGKLQTPVTSVVLK